MTDSNRPLSADDTPEPYAVLFDESAAEPPFSKFALISDLHANLPALETALEDIDKRQYKNIICCGDIVGYGAHPNECTEIIRERGIPCIMGNHDHMAIHMVNVESFNRIAGAAILWTHEQLTPANVEYLKGLPYVIEKEDFTFVHGSPSEPEQWKYILTRGEARRNFNCFDTWICFVGHSHQPFVVEYVDPRTIDPSPDTNNPNGDISVADLEPQLLCPEPTEIELNREKRYLINVGSVGQPRDRDPRLCYVTVDLEEMRLTFHRLDYPIAKAQQAIVAANLPVELAQRLSMGR